MLSQQKIIGYCCLVAFLVLTNISYPEDEDMSEPNQSNFAMPTMGGKQFWADELYFHKWRIQQNVFTGHYRLLDGSNRRHASGSLDVCCETLEQIKVERNLSPMQGKAVIVMHGLFRSRSSMSSLCDYLAKNGGYDEVFNVTYPTTRYDIGEHARSLARIIDNLDGIEQIDFVAHSMGNIVIRHYLADVQKQDAEKNPISAASNTTQIIRPKLHRFVMLSPPNHEADIATFFGNNILFKTITGQSGQQLGRQWNDLESKLAAPDFQFGIVAGGKGNGKGYNLLLPGDNDGTITVESTKLAGARDFIVLPVLHSFIMNNDKVQELTLKFLQEGYFISEEERQPLEK
jgi:pimeloyl-ACP methyl ester carboxylesterase